MTWTERRTLASLLSWKRLQSHGMQSCETSPRASVLHRKAEPGEVDSPHLVTRRCVTSCPDAHFLIAYSEGTLRTETIQAIESHLAGCLQCRELCDRLLEFECTQNIRVLGDRFAILKKVGHGGMGTVYQVLDLQTQETIALKLLRPELACDGRSIRRFENELRLARTITHPNVCRSHSFGWTSESAFITMEFIEGKTLRELLRLGCTLSVPQGLAIARQICAGLLELHKHGIIHRDLKPENVIVTDFTRVVLVDFGLAQLVGGESTISAGLVGTPAYMAPEQIEGKVADRHTDIYALGLMLYEMFTGTVPFAEESAIAFAMKHLHEFPPQPRVVNSSIPHLLEHAILRCLEKNPTDRFDSVTEIDKLFEKIGATCARDSGNAASTE